MIHPKITRQCEKSRLATETHGVRLLSAQPGYPGEDTGWTGPGYLEI